MIRINLLPVRQKRGHQSTQTQLWVGVLLVIGTLLGCTIWIMNVADTLENRQEQIKIKRAELNRLNRQLKQVEDLKKTMKELKEKLAIIDKLSKSKTGPVRVLDDLSKETPPQVWLTSVKDTSGTMSIEGMSTDHEHVSAFMKSLQTSKFFSNVILKHSKETKTKEATLYNFTITCQVNYSA